jgi:putative ABC transport system permease protein
MMKTGSRSFVNLFSIIAAFVLLIACINYINISTSKATRRAREVGMRKTLGANKAQLVKQFLGESLLLVLFSCGLGLGLLYFMVPYFNELTGKSLPLSILFHPYVVTGSVLIILLVTIFSGFYPAYVLSSFQPSSVLKGSSKSNVSGNLPRYVLITFQFTITIIMIAGTLIVHKQIRFVLSKDLGFDKEHVLVMNLTETVVNKREVFKNDVDNFKNVVSTSVGSTALGRGPWSSYVIPEGHTSETEVEARMFPVDGNFQNTYSLEMAMGRFFNTLSASDSNAVIINETMMHKLGWSDPTKMTIKFSEEDAPVPVIGVLKDFYFKSLYEEIEPVVMWISSNNQNKMSVKFTGNPSDLISFLETRWKEYETRYPFQYTFVDEAFAKNYQSEEKLLKTIILFAGISILIACLGLYGLVSFTIEQRTKEFGIRKVLGASVASINYLVNKKFMVMVVIASLVAIPTIIPIMQEWLSKFAIKIEIGVLPLMLAVIITLLVSCLAITIQAMKAAMQNPVKSLKHD